jgi:hypothetical protein
LSSTPPAPITCMAATPSCSQPWPRSSPALAFAPTPELPVIRAAAQICRGTGYRGEIPTRGDRQTGAPTTDVTLRRRDLDWVRYAPAAFSMRRKEFIRERRVASLKNIFRPIRQHRMTRRPPHPTTNIIETTMGRRCESPTVGKGVRLQGVADSTSATIEKSTRLNGTKYHATSPSRTRL